MPSEADDKSLEYQGWRWRMEEYEFDIKQLREEIADLKRMLANEPALREHYSFSVAQKRLDMAKTREDERSAELMQPEPEPDDWLSLTVKRVKEKLASKGPNACG